MGKNEMELEINLLGNASSPVQDSPVSEQRNRRPGSAVERTPARQMTSPTSLGCKGKSQRREIRPSLAVRASVVKSNGGIG